MDELGFVSNLGLITSNLSIQGWTREMPFAVVSVQRGQRVRPFLHPLHEWEFGMESSSSLPFLI
jgi:hypothetical protein